MEKSNLDIFVVDAGAHSFRAGRAEDFPTDSATPHTVLQSVVRAVGADDADSARTSTTQVRFSRDDHRSEAAGLLGLVLFETLGSKCARLRSARPPRLTEAHLLVHDHTYSAFASTGESRCACVQIVGQSGCIED